MASLTRVAPRRPNALTLTLGSTILVAAWLLLLLSGDAHHLSGFWTSFALWNVMMVAMMLPSLYPWLRLLDRPRYAAPFFLLGYFLLWASYCLLATIAQTWLGPSLTLPRAAGSGVLMAAGLFQLTPLKSACLRHCRSPIGFLLTHWRAGRIWAFRIGLVHGANCLGCCWALMAVALALGVMNLLWMAALSLMMLVEKTFPRGETLGRAFGVALALWSLARLLT